MQLLRIAHGEPGATPGLFIGYVISMRITVSVFMVVMLTVAARGACIGYCPLAIGRIDISRGAVGSCSRLARG